MTEQLKLLKGYDFKPDSDEISLIGGTAGFDVAYNGWTPKVVPDRDGRIREAITLRIQGTSTNDLAGKVQQLTAKRSQALDFVSMPNVADPVWLRVQLYGESNARQSLVYNLDHMQASSVYDVAMRKYHHINLYTLGIERAPWWESTNIGTISAGSVPTLGGTFAYNNLSGDLPARLARVTVRPVDVGGGGTALETVELFPHGQFWLGFRSSRFGTPSAWTPYRAAYNNEWLKGTLDPYSFAGTVLRGGLGIPGIHTSGPRLTMNDISATPAAMVGRFRVLARLRYSEFSTELQQGDIVHLVYMTTAYLYDTYKGGPDDKLVNYRTYPSVPIRSLRDSKGSYFIYDMGEVEYPPLKGIPDPKYFMIWLRAKVIQNDYTDDDSSEPKLYWDTLFFVPTMEGFYWGGRQYQTEIDFHNVYTRIFQGHNTPDGRNIAVITTTSSIVNGEAQSFSSGGVPPGDGIAVFVADAHRYGHGSEHANTWKCDITLNTVERWESMRGNA